MSEIEKIKMDRGLSDLSRLGLVGQAAKKFIDNESLFLSYIQKVFDERTNDGSPREMIRDAIIYYVREEQSKLGGACNEGEIRNILIQENELIRSLFI